MLFSNTIYTIGAFLLLVFQISAFPVDFSTKSSLTIARGLTTEEPFLAVTENEFAKRASKSNKPDPKKNNSPAPNTPNGSTTPSTPKAPNNSDADDKSKPAGKIAVPTVAEIKKHLIVKPNTSIFYSRIGPNTGSYKPVAMKWRDTYHKTGKVLEESWDTKQTWTTTYGKASVQARADQDLFWDNACKALAQLASGTVYVVLGPKIVAPNWGDMTTVWARIEWPALKDNANVKQVIQIDPETNKRTVIKGEK
ncbi:hypothetical protein B0O99DRAFT_386447 [Bisporella sp. PMI_857]|nr:hypothetical protein B0O99DRAFT_386447 [Bisporella sp. PMI_857]